MSWVVIKTLSKLMIINTIPAILSVHRGVSDLIPSEFSLFSQSPFIGFTFFNHEVIGSAPMDLEAG